MTLSLPFIHAICDIMIYQIYYDANSFKGVCDSNPIVTPFGVFKAKQHPRNPEHFYDDQRLPNLTAHNTLCEWRVLYYVWKHHPSPWVGFTSWAHNQKQFHPAIASVTKGHCESVLKHHNIAGFCLRPLRQLILPDVPSELDLTLKLQYNQWSLMEKRNGINYLDSRRLPLGKYHDIKYWNFVMEEYHTLYGINLEKELDFVFLGTIQALHTWCNAFVARWDYFDAYMTRFSPIVMAMLEHFGSHPTELELSYICERLIILHNYIKYANNEFKPRS